VTGVFSGKLRKLLMDLEFEFRGGRCGGRCQ
jgi:hypothetical protein